MNNLLLRLSSRNAIGFVKMSFQVGTVLSAKAVECSRCRSLAILFTGKIPSPLISISPSPFLGVTQAFSQPMALPSLFYSK